MKYVVAAAQDPGGAESIAPVLKELSSMAGTELLVLAAKHSKDIFDKHQIQYQDADSLSKEDVKKLLSKSRPDVVVTATSTGNSIEKKLLWASKKLGFPALSVLDFWSEYKCRFSEGEDDLSLVPNLVCVMDDVARKEMINNGFEESRIEVTGNPQFDELLNLRKKLEETEKSFGEVAVIAYFSQPVKSVFGEKDSQKYLGYTEEEALNDVLSALDDIKSKKNLRLILRLHPKEDKSKYVARLKQRKYVFIDKNKDYRDTIMESEVILGMFSMVLFEASLIGKKVISYQPNLVNKEKDMLKSNQMGLSEAVYDKKEIHEALVRAIVTNRKQFKAPQVPYFYDGKSTQRVIAKIEQLINPGDS